MTYTLSASFSDRSAAREAFSLLRSDGCRAALNAQRPAAPPVPGLCPGNGLPGAMENSVMVPDPHRAVVTVLVTPGNQHYVQETLRRCGGTPIL